MSIGLLNNWRVIMIKKNYKGLQRGSFDEFMMAVTILVGLVALVVLLYIGYFTGPTCQGLCG